MHHVGELGIRVVRAFRNLDIGTAMTSELIDTVRNVGVTVLTLHMYAHNDRARYVYAKLGFREVGRIPKYYYRNNTYIDKVIMALILE